MAIWAATENVALADASHFCREGRRLLYEAGDPAAAIPYFQAALALDPRHHTDHYFLALAHMCLGDGKAAEHAARYLSLDGWRMLEPSSGSPGGWYYRSGWAVLVGYFGLRQAGRDAQAKEWLDEAAAKCDRSRWPWPLIAYLRGETEAEAVYRTAQQDHGWTSGFQLVHGMKLALERRFEDALTHLRWVRDYGDKDFITAARCEIERVLRAQQHAHVATTDETRDSEKRFPTEPGETPSKQLHRPTPSQVLKIDIQVPNDLDVLSDVEPIKSPDEVVKSVREAS